MPGKAKKSGAMENLTENIITRMVARSMSIIGVPVAGFLLWQVYSDVQTAAAAIPLMNQRIEALERNSAIVELKARLDKIENRLYYINRSGNSARPDSSGGGR